MKKLIVILSLLLCGCQSSEAETTIETNNTNQTIEKEEKENDETMNVTYIQCTINDQIAIIELNNSITSQDLLSTLPTTLTFENYSDNEKISTPDKTLSLEEAPDGYQPSEGDVTVYGPWGNIAIFTEDASYGSGLVPLGKVIEGFEYIKDMDEGTVVEVSIVE